MHWMAGLPANLTKVQCYLDIVAWYVTVVARLVNCLLDLLGKVKGDSLDTGIYRTRSYQY